MDKSMSLSISLFIMAVVMATVMSFGGMNDRLGGLGDGDNFGRNFQNWLEKRGLGQPSVSFGQTLPGDSNRFFNWRDYLTSLTKRQLSYGPRSFGNFQRYFTNGLQDWRSTYNGLKKRDVQKDAQPAA